MAVAKLNTPPLVVFINTLPPLLLPVTISNIPSAFISPTTIELIVPYTVKSVPLLKEEVVIVPLVFMLFKCTRTEPLPAFTMSTLPSLLKSPAAIMTSLFTEPPNEENKILFPNQLPLIGLPEIGRLTVLNAEIDWAILLFEITEIGEWVLLAGTETDNSVVEAVLTTAFVLPK